MPRIATSAFLMFPRFPCSLGYRKQVERWADSRPIRDPKGLAQDVLTSPLPSFRSGAGCADVL